MLETVTTNSWLACALGLAARLFLPGLAWAWAWPAATEEAGDRLRQWVGVGARAAGVGLLAVVLSAAFLAELGWYTPGAEWGVLGAISAAGVVAGVLKNRRAFCSTVLQGLPMAGLVAAGAAVIMLLPRQGEWIMGGWDPGVYMDEGVWVSHNGTFRPEPDPVFSRFDAREFRTFTREVVNFKEGHPVFPIDPETRSFKLFFFRLTPTWIAVLDRCGGLRAATRVNLFTGLLTALLFLAVLWSISRTRLQAFMSLLFLVSQPLWLYHLHIPTSEVLQAGLLCLLFLFVPHRDRPGVGRAILPACLFALTVNRYSFLPFGVLFLLAVAVLDFHRADRRQAVRERLGQIGALAAGVLYDYATTPITIERLAFIVPSLFAVAGVVLALTLVVDWVAEHEQRRAFWLAFSRRFSRPLALLGLLALAGTLAAWFVLRGSDSIPSGIRRIAPYFGPGFLGASLVGLGVLILRWHSISLLLKCLIFYCLALTLATLQNDAIANLYPWATRRFVEFTVPLVAVLSGLAVAAAWPDRFDRRIRGALAVGAAFAILAVSARQSYHAWTRTEYDGYSDLLASIARQIEPTDIVVADHFLYGTPLRFIYGKHILNGEVLWSRRNPKEMQAALTALRRIVRPGERIRFLTSTSKGLDVYPVAIEPASLDWTSPPFVYEDLQHHPRADGFELRSHERVFRLYTVDVAASGSSKAK
ncbi:MAG: hypothetical protein A2X46_06310 [Lentisphaerae bacterium GWF2_57_35]|nr:MAG: hypothetical protein A2X46_06310 [Lentisphaerae bacterium GWF2_57_35]